MKNNELFNNMRKTVSYIILLIEIVCLFVNFYVPSKRKANHWHEPIIIPDNMQLTLTDDEQFQTLGGDTYTVPGGRLLRLKNLMNLFIAFWETLSVMN